jgi:hypothetical protein
MTRFGNKTGNVLLIFIIDILLGRVIVIVPNVMPGNPYRRGRVSTIDLLALTNQDQMLFYTKKTFFSYAQQAVLTVR